MCYVRKLVGYDHYDGTDSVLLRQTWARISMDNLIVPDMIVAGATTDSLMVNLQKGIGDLELITISRTLY